MERRRVVPVKGSERVALPGARPVGPAPREGRIEITVVVRRAPGGVAAAQADLDGVAAFAASHGLDVVASDAARRSLALAGSVAGMEEAFGVDLAEYDSPGGTYRGREGMVHVPEALGEVVEAVLGLDDRPQARPQFHVLPAADGRLERHARDASFAPPTLAALYEFPADFDGSGETIALIELGGGYDAGDLDAYFEGLEVDRPRVRAVAIDGARNAPTGDPSGPDGEVMLDIEVAGAVAPGAEIVVYFAPNTDRGFFDAISRAIHATPPPAAVSISWGAREPLWTTQAVRQFDEAFRDAGKLGVTICCASGDAGSTDGGIDGLAHVDFPASSPHVLACGGTRLEVRDGAISRETVWNAAGAATGGGVSDVFPLPSWQRSAGVPRSSNGSHRRGRGVPDVAGDADPATGYRVLVDGREAVFGGTSAVAPLWAALVARINQRAGRRVGFLNPILYSAGARAALRDVTTGANGSYRAGPGWDACTGLGSPNGTKLAAALA